MRRALLASYLLGCFACTQSLPLHHLMTWPEYGRVEHGTPYILEIRPEPGALLLFGAWHMKGEPGHPQVEQIQELWRKFQPTLAFNEGWDPPVVQNAREAVDRYGEPGLLRYLADRDGVPIYDMEPPEEERYRYLLQRFTVEEIRLHKIAQNVSQNLRTLPDEEVDKQVLGQIRRHLDPQPLLDGPPGTISELDESFQRLMPNLGNWRRLETTDLNPRPATTFLGQISAYSGRLRDRHMLKVMIESVRRGERVFAVVGATHVVMQEPVFRRAFPRHAVVQPAAPRIR